MNRCRRLLVVSARAPFGNAEPFLRVELAALHTHFERIALMPVRTPHGALQPLPQNVDVLPWPLFSADIAVRAFGAFLRAPRRTLSVLSALARSGEPGRLKNAAVMAKALALAGWVRRHGYEHIHAYWLSAPATVAMAAARIAGVPWSATAHRWDIYERNAFDVKMRDASFVRAISRKGAEDVRLAMPALDRIISIPLGAQIPPAPVRIIADAAELHAVCPAALVPVKGHAGLLLALALLRDRGIPVRCTFAGDGPLYERLSAHVRALGLEQRVAFAGYVPQHDLHEGYRTGRFGAVVLASRHDGSASMEGIPSALIEAMAFGVPVVATASGSIGELVDETCGHLVPCGDVEALAAALADVLRRPSDAASRAGAAYRRVAVRHDAQLRMLDLSEAISGERILA